MAQYIVTDTELEAVADAIRAKTGGSEGLEWPSGFVDAIDDISVGGESTLISKTITSNGVYDPADDNVDGYSEITVDVTSIENGLIPNMVSNTQPKGVASCSSYLNSNFDAYKAFNKNLPTSDMQGSWLAATGDQNPYIAYTFDSPKKFDYIVIKTANNGASATRDVTIQGQKNDDSWENCLKSGSTVTLSFNQNTYGDTSIEHTISLNGNSYKAIKITGSQPFYMGPNQTACSFGSIQVYTYSDKTTEAYKIWSKSTGGNDAALYVQKGLISFDNFIETFTPTEEATSILYTTVTSNSISIENKFSIRYSNSWIVKALSQVIGNYSLFEANETIKTWPYNASTSLIII